MRNPEMKTAAVTPITDRGDFKIYEPDLNTPPHRKVQVTRLSKHFGLTYSTAALVADLAFPIGGCA